MLDLGIVVIIFIFAIIGYKRGVIKSALTLGSSVIALILSFIVYPLVEMLLKITPVYGWIYQVIDNKIKDITFSNGLQSQANAITESISWIPDILVEQIKANNNKAMYDMLGVTNVREYISLYITQILIGLLAILITWLTLKIVLGIAVRLIVGIVEHVPVVSTLNRQGGGCLGIIKGVLILSLIALVIPIFVDIPIIQNIDSAIQTNYIAKWLYENNIIIIMYDYLFL